MTMRQLALSAAAVSFFLACGSSGFVEATPETICQAIDPNSAVCGDGVNRAYMYICERGQMTAIPCRGPNGCAKTSSNRVLCDYSGNLTGDPCPSFESNRAQCATGAKGMVVCESNWRFKVYPCNGAKGCYTTDTKVTCEP